MTLKLPQYTLLESNGRLTAGPQSSSTQYCRPQMRLSKVTIRDLTKWVHNRREVATGSNFGRNRPPESNVTFKTPTPMYPVYPARIQQILCGLLTIHS